MDRFVFENFKNGRSGILRTRKGDIHTPTFIPVHTFGGHFQIDELVRNYLPRVSQAVMVSRYYAKEMKDFPLPVFMDSGGFAGSFKDTKFVVKKERGLKYASVIVGDEEITPISLIEEQEKKADIAFTLDIFIPPGISIEEAKLRQSLSLNNALLALDEKRSRKMLLFASLQAWNRKSAHYFASQVREHGFDGLGIGGLIPRLGDLRLGDLHTIREIVLGAKEGAPDLPMHAFGIGSPKVLNMLFRLGIDSADSASFARYSLEKRYLIPNANEYIPLKMLKGKTLPCNCPVCRANDADFLLLDNPMQNMLLSLHNLMCLEMLAKASLFFKINNEEQKNIDDFSIKEKQSKTDIKL
ncbi:MAG: tRNA-guanine transglycosylase [Thermoplasmata archaeon]